MNYTPYHIHDDTSNVNGFADSCTSYNEYIKLAKNNNMKAIAFSNHGGMYDWVKKKQACDKAKIKYIHGVELYLCHEYQDNNRGWHIGLYAKNLDGVKELNTIMSMATSKGCLEDNSDRRFYFNPRISFKDLFSTSDNIIVTTACLASALWRLQTSYKDNEEKEYNRTLLKQLIEWIAKNKHRCFLEIQYHNCEHQKQFNNMLYKLNLKYGIPLIAGTDTHSSTPYKAECRKILQKSKDSYYGEEDEFDLTWKTYDELIECFRIQNSIPVDAYMKAIENTNVFADMVEEFTLDKSFKYPDLYGSNENEVWRKLIFKKLKEKVDKGWIDKNKLEDYKNSILIEYNAMSKQSMASFMIFMSELMTWCRENGIQSSPCRGSVGGSLIAYITDVTDVDPIVHKTVFSRFCNADRVSLADIDQDFAPNDRKKVYEYIISRFGSKNVAYILTLGTIQDRGSIDVLAKGLEYQDLNKVKEIKNSFDNIFNEYEKIVQEEVNLEELEGATSKAPNFDDFVLYSNAIRNKKKLNRLTELNDMWVKLRNDNKDLFYYFDGIKGTVISKGNHPAGMIGSPITLYDNLGVFYKGGDENFPISFCSMKAVDSLNYVKFDILGLKTIGVLQDTFKLANVKWKYAHEIDWFDKRVWEDMIRCNSGIFQFEGDYAHDLLSQFKPSILTHMSIINAALRPSGKSYRQRLVDGEFNNNPSNEIDELLKDNRGFLVFQEDTIKFLTDICDFSGSLADTTRRAIGKKDVVLLNEQLPKILEGYCNHSSKPREVAELEAKEFIQIISDSSEYQFGYNHSTGYSMNGYMCAYARTYHTIEYITSYFNWAENNDDVNNGVKLVNEYGITLKDCQFRYSKGGYFFDNGTNTIYKGVSSIKFLNDKCADELYELRNNKYNSFVELLSDISTKTSANSRQVEILITLNYFKEFGKTKRLLEINNIYNSLYERKQIKKADVFSLGLTSELLDRYSNKITEKLYKDIDMVGLISEITSNIENKDMPLADKLSYEIEYLGYPKTKIETLETDLRYVMKIDTYENKKSFTHYATLYNIKTGEQEKLRVGNFRYYCENKFEEKNIICIDETSQKQKRRKNENVEGGWEVVEGEFNTILDQWTVF